MIDSNSMEHCNGDQICVIDTETTGLDPFFHEMVQICILPLDANLKVRKDVFPFYINMKPDYPERIDQEAMKVNKIKDLHKGHCREKAKDMLVDWIDKLGLPQTKWGRRKLITPLGQNFSFDKMFMLAWLGNDMFSEFFSYTYRDTMTTALWMNDQASFHARKVPFSKVKLGWLANQYKIELTNAHDALADCAATAEVYRKMCLEGLL